MVDDLLLKILVCPENKTPVALADAVLIEKINAGIAAKTLKNRGGEIIGEPVEEGLIREDGKYLYIVREDIPIMLIDEAVALEQLV